MSALLNLTKELNKLHFPSLQLSGHGCLECVTWWPSGIIMEVEHFTWGLSGIINGEVSVKANGGTLRMPLLRKHC